MERDMGARGMRGRWVGGMRVWMGVLGILVGSGVCVFAKMGNDSLTIGQNDAEEPKPYFYAKMDTAGYSDWIWYGPSDLHPVESFHELLSGEWGAAIYYDGVDTPLIDPANSSLGRQAMWLTRQFQTPNWNTNGRFNTYETFGAWHDGSNPTPGPNTGQSKIRDGSVEITIDYEIVDLGETTTNRSPMIYRDPDTGQFQYMNSDRYCFLQTYTIRNIDPNEVALTNVALYQMLHSHGADEYRPVLCSTYSDYSANDPLAGYTPLNLVHQVGNFRYDITQWNDTHRAASTRSHTDFVGFSSTQEPDWVDNGTYIGAEERPATGTHLRIENRSLNNATGVYFNEVAGAMGWNLGTLAPNATTSLTVAVMFGQEKVITSPIVLTKTDNIGSEGCVGPGQEITYTICWDNVTLADANDAVLIDYLPRSVSYPQAGWTMDPNGVFVLPDGGYDAATHSYRWELGTIPAEGSGCVELTVTVNEQAEPGMPIVNRARLSTGNMGVAEISHETAACCRGGDIIYVDPRATGNDTGISWTDAYTDLQRALTRARGTTCTTVDEIRIAYGEYDPGRDAGTTFAIHDDYKVYGGYRGGSVDPNDRDPKRYRTILTGLGDGGDRNETIVTMGDNTLLDGVTVRDAAYPGRGILADGVTFTLSNCVIEDNLQYGIRGIGCNATIQWCTIRNNTWCGIFQDGAGNIISIENCHIRDNQQYGLYLVDSISSVKNSVISRNGNAGTIYFGIWVINPEATSHFHNNTIAYNRNAGIAYTEDDSDYTNQPDIQNCILWYNNQAGNGEQQAGHKVATHYSCVYDPNDPAGSSTTLDANYNFSHKPDFAYSNEPNNVHLAANSFCINKGNPNLTYLDPNDIDHEDRVMGSRIDVGADEVNPDCDDVYNEYDWNADGVINLYEFDTLSRAWQSRDPNDPGLTDPNESRNWNPRCNFDPTGDSQYRIDLEDLIVFSHDIHWGWVACWRLDLQPEQLEMMMSMVPEGRMLTQSLSAFSAIETATVTPEIPLREQILELKDTIQFLEKLWLNDPSVRQEIDPDEWKIFMDKVYESFNEFKMMNSKSLDLPEESQ